MNELDEEKAKQKKIISRLEAEVTRLKYMKEKKLNYDRMAFVIAVAILGVALLFKIIF